MASEGSPFAGFNPALLPAGLLALALLLGLLTFAVGWFAVTTRIQVYEYDETAEDGRGEFTGLNVRVHTEFELLQLNSRIEPDSIERGLEERSDLPSYENEMDQTGSKMLGLFLFNLVAFVSLASTAGFYLWNRKSPRDFTRAIYRFTGLFAVFALVILVYLYSQVPAAAERDTHEILDAYEIYMQNLPGGLPDLSRELLEPNIEFWNKWICCPPVSTIDCQQYGTCLIVVTTESRPSAGFWLLLGESGLVAAALVMGTRAGQLGSKEPEPTKPPEIPPAYKAA